MEREKKINTYARSEFEYCKLELTIAKSIGAIYVNISHERSIILGEKHGTLL